MRNTIMQTYSEIVNARKEPTKSSELFYEYVSSYRRVTMVLDGATWCLRVTYRGFFSELKAWEKTYGDKETCAAWTNIQVANREIGRGCLTIKEAPGKILINRINN